METITTDTFQLEMKGDWKVNRADDGGKFSLFSEANGVDITLSTFTFSADYDLDRMAEKLIEFRLNAEQSAAEHFNCQMEIADPQVFPSDRGLYAQYFGRDSLGRHFRYFAVLVPGKLMNIYTESNTADFEQLERSLQEVFAGLQF